MEEAEPQGVGAGQRTTENRHTYLGVAWNYTLKQTLKNVSAHTHTDFLTSSRLVQAAITLFPASVFALFTSFTG